MNTIWARGGAVFVAVVLCVLPFMLDWSGSTLPVGGQRMLGIFLLSIVLWITQCIPLHATAAVIILLEILLISDQTLLTTLPDAPSFRSFFHALADPVLMLFLGGFFIADGAAKFRLDRSLAGLLLRPFGRSPRTLMLGLMLITACFSMFMSNTATTATLMMVVLPVIRQLPPGHRMRSSLVLAIAVAANIGGMGTPIGTPPNAIAIAAMAKVGLRVSFLTWMLMMIPFMLVLLMFAWMLLAGRRGSDGVEVAFEPSADFVKTPSALIYYATTVFTIVLWLTEGVHGLSSSVVGFVPVTVLLATGVFSGHDLKGIDWQVLWLVAGGIALGQGVGATGLDGWLISLVHWDQLGPRALVVVLVLVSLVMSTLISNSATANLLVPIGLAMAMSPAVAMSPMIAGVMIAVGCSLAMALPTSTPPNAMAVSAGEVRMSQMAWVGIVVGAVGWLLFALVAPVCWRLLGLLQ